MTRSVEPLLGTRAEVALTAESPEAARLAEQAVIDEVIRLEAVFTVFDESSELRRLRRTGTTDVAELLTVMELAAEWQTRTGGAFHANAQSLVDLWDRAEVAGKVPSDTDLGHAVAALTSLVITAELNLNAIAKGWIAEAALHKAVDGAKDVAEGWLSLGGDVVHSGDGSVTVGIEDPDRPYDNVAPMATVELANEALATSGGARRWWTIDEHRFSKVLDPRTGRPIDHIASATVIAPDGAIADVLATVALVLSPDETLTLVAEANAQCFLVGRDGLITSSSDRFRPS